MTNYNRYIDNTLLKPEATAIQIKKLVQDSIQFNFKGVCVNSAWIKLVKSELNGNKDIEIVSVVGFPLGANITQSKVFEAKLALEHGATEIDMVINIGKLKEGNYEYVLNDIKKVKEAAKDNVLKVIIETALLKKIEIEKASQIILEAGADFVKTSTGFSFRGANFEDIEIIKNVVQDKIEIKAAGGIKTLEDMEKMINLGATRIGTSRGPQLLK